MGQDHGPHVLGTDADAEQLRPDLVLRTDIEPDRPPIVGMPAREVSRLTRPGGLARVHNDQAIARIDGPGEDRERFGPGTVEQDVGLTYRASSPPHALTLFDANSPGLDGVDLHKDSSPG